MPATRVSKFVASVLLAAGGLTLSVTAAHQVQHIPGVVGTAQGTGTTTVVDTTDDVTWGR
ncbi:hypothetical protein [Streptomyces sp. NPDC003393]